MSQWAIPKMRGYWNQGEKCKVTIGYFSYVNLFKHRFLRLRRRRPMADPSTAAARLQVIGMSCDLARSMPATRRHSDRLGFDRLARTGLGFFLTRDAPRVLRKATEVDVGFREARVC